MQEEVRVPPVLPEGMRGRRVVCAPTVEGRGPVTVVAVVVGGWLKDQTARTLQPALRANGIWTVSPEGWNDWKAPIAEMALETVREVRGKTGGEVRLALIGHSFGGQAVCDAVGELAQAGIFPGMVGLIDPVSPKMGIPKPVVLHTGFRDRGGELRVYYRWFLLGPIRAKVVDHRGARVAGLWSGCRRMGLGHNTMCHGRVVGELVGMVRGMGRGS